MPGIEANRHRMLAIITAVQADRGTPRDLYSDDATAGFGPPPSPSPPPPSPSPPSSGAHRISC